MATWGCLDCTAAYSVGAPRCPHCGSTNYTERPMPKITVHGGVSDRTRPLPPVEGEDGPQDEVRDGDEYGSWPFAALRTEAKERGLSGAGTAAELAARLREDDEVR